jgi:hypothetical protein
MKVNEMEGASGMYGGEMKCVQVLVRKSEGRGTLGRHRG